MLAQQCFRTATVLFYEGSYEQALLSINRYLQLRAGNSLGYSNRALIHFHMGNSVLARQDIRTALQLNHLNYVAMFNLFSLEARQKDYRAALLALQAALACVLLIKGRLSGDKGLVRRSFELAEGNFEALVLYVLMEVREGGYGEALKVLQVAEVGKQNRGIVQKMRVFIKELKEKYSVVTEEALYDYLLELKLPQQRIVARRQVVEQMIEEEVHGTIAKCVQQFNRLYSQINKITGGASYLKAKTPELPVASQQFQRRHQEKIQKGSEVAVVN